MSKPDFYRIGELFYRNVNREAGDNSLEGFVKAAFNGYLEATKYIHEKYIIATFPSQWNDDYLRLTIVWDGIRTDLNRVEYKASTSEPEEVLKALKGTFDASFKGFPLDDVNPELRRKIQKTRKGYYAKVGRLGIFFLPGTNRIRKVEYEKKNWLVPWLHDYDIDRRVKPNNEAMHLLSEATKIEMLDAFYMDDNPALDLINASCDIVNHKGDFEWKFNISAMNYHGLPAHVFEQLKGLFGLMQSSFDESSFERMQLTYPKDIEMVEVETFGL